MLSLFGFHIIRVEGRSMSPTLETGDYVVLQRFGLRKPRVNDLIIYTHDDGGLRIKRIADIHDDGFYAVRGDGVLSAPSIDLGPVHASVIRGRVLFKIKAQSPTSEVKGGDINRTARL